MSGFELKNSIDLLPRTEIAAIQDRLLAEHIRYCRMNSPFYRRTLAAFPDRDYNYGLLQELPTTSKYDFAACNDDFFAVPQQDIADISFTSGTTGHPCRIAYTKSDLDRLAYNDAVGFVSAGMTPEDKVLLTCTIDRCFIAGLAYYMGTVKVGASAIRNGLNSIDSHAEIVKELRPDMIVGVPSFLAKLCTRLVEMSVDISCIRKLIGIGEPIRTRAMDLTPLGKKLEELLPDRIHSTYASSEMATSFTECAARNGGHPPADLIIVEILDEDGNRVPDGEPGEITVTPVRVTGTPLIRFRTGDISFIIPGPCSCGRNSVRLGPILGRKSQMLKVHGTTLFPNAFFHVLDSMSGIAEYFMEVGGTALSDEVTMYVACKNGATSDEINGIQE